MERMLSLVILAGGKSRRMGTDKSDLIYQDRTFLEIQAEKGKRLAIGEILVSGYRGSDYSGRIVPDRLAGRGPLGGLEACFRQASSGRCLVLSVDVPLVSVLELERLIEAAKRNPAPATILQHGEKQEPLIGVYDTALSDAMAEALAQGNGSVFAFLKKTGYGVYHSRGEESQFQNINEREDYKRLLQEWKKQEEDYEGKSNVSCDER